MTHHVFLTGKKQIGKSTFLRKILERYHGNAGGFLTVRTSEYLKDSYSVHIYRFGEEKIPNEENLLFVCGKCKKNISERFDLLGCQTLSSCSDCSLIVMDELGPHEADAKLFHEAVLRLLDHSIPVIGVLQAPAEAFWPEITAHPMVKIIEISKDNRDDEAVIRQVLSMIDN